MSEERMIGTPEHVSKEELRTFLEKHFVRTAIANGLTMADAEKAIDIIVPLNVANQVENMNHAVQSKGKEQGRESNRNGKTNRYHVSDSPSQNNNNNNNNSDSSSSIGK
jgi:hypothetical protein